MDINGAHDAMFRVLPLMLGGAARTWFTRLKPGSISSSNQETTISHVVYNTKNIQSNAVVCSKIQWYIEYCIDNGAIQAMMLSLRTEVFLKAFIDDPPKIYLEILARSQYSF